MSNIKVKYLKEKLQNAIDALEDLNDEDNIHLEPNTYFLHGANNFLGISGYDGGYLDLDRIEEAVEDEDNEDEEECDE